MTTPLTYQQLVHQALELQVQIQDLKSATYTVVEHTDPRGGVYMFVASFDMESMEYAFTMTDANFIEVKGFAQVHSEVIAEFGAFVSRMLAFTKGEPHPYAENIVANNPEVMSGHSMTRGNGIDSDHAIEPDDKLT